MLRNKENTGINKNRRQIYYDVLLILGTLGAYCAVFILFYHRFGGAIAAFAVLPVIMAAWLWGVRAGIIFSLLMLPINTILFNILIA